MFWQILVLISIESMISNLMTMGVVGYCVLAGIDLIGIKAISRNKSGSAYAICNILFLSMIACLICASISLSYQNGYTEYSAYLAAFELQHALAVVLTVLTIIIAVGGSVTDDTNAVGRAFVVRALAALSGMGSST